MGIETDHRVRQLEQRLVALEGAVQALQSGAANAAAAHEAPAEPVLKRTGKTSKAKAAAAAGKGRS